MLFALVLGALLPLQSPAAAAETTTTTTTTAPTARDVEGVVPEVEEPAPPPPPTPIVDPAALDRHDHDDDAHLVSQSAPKRRRVDAQAAAIVRHDDAIRRAMIIGLTGLGAGLLLGGGFGLVALTGPAHLRLGAGIAAPLVVVAAPTAAQLLFAHDIEPSTPWFTAGGVFVGGLVGGIVGAVLLVPLSTLADNRNDVLYDSPAESFAVFLPIAGLALGAAGGVVAVASGAGNHIDIE